MKREEKERDQGMDRVTKESFQLEDYEQEQQQRKQHR